MLENGLLNWLVFCGFLQLGHVIFLQYLFVLVNCFLDLNLNFGIKLFLVDDMHQVLIVRFESRLVFFVDRIWVGHEAISVGDQFVTLKQLIPQPLNSDAVLSCLFLKFVVLILVLKIVDVVRGEVAATAQHTVLWDGIALFEDFWNLAGKPLPLLRRRHLVVVHRVGAAELMWRIKHLIIM